MSHIFRMTKLVYDYMDVEENTHLLVYISFSDLPFSFPEIRSFEPAKAELFFKQPYSIRRDFLFQLDTKPLFDYQKHDFFVNITSCLEVRGSTIFSLIRPPTFCSIRRTYVLFLTI